MTNDKKNMTKFQNDTEKNDKISTRKWQNDTDKK